MKTFQLPSVILKRRKPVNITQADVKLFESEFERTVQVATLIKRNFVFCDTEKAFNPEGIIPESTVYKWNKAGQLKWVFQQWLSEKYQKLRYHLPLVYICDEFSYGYFHFTVDTLQKVWMAKKQFGKDFILFLNYPVLASYHQKLLAPFQISDIVHNPEKRHYNLGTVWFPEHPFKPVSNSNGRPEIIQDISHTILNYYKVVQNPAYSKIYVSRKKALNRHIQNEEEVEQMLEKAGFNIVCFEDHTLEKQLEICYSADIMIGLHGAGLTNMIYMKPGSKIAEVRQKGDAHNNCYFSLASDCKLDYYYLLCDTNSADVHKADFIVDLDVLGKLIEDMSVNHL